jgi:DNA-binding transcriptional MerR regulator/SAM-dependent methyltransferase
MKIGMFAQKNKITIDTIRHYIDMELIFPMKSDKQYEFDENCQNDFDTVATLKKLGFSLSDIKNISLIRRLGQMSQFQQDDYYLGIFKGKLQNVDAEIEKLTQVKSRLCDEVQRLSVLEDMPILKMGVHLSCLNKLRCHKCGESLVLSEAAVVDGMVMHGKLECRCSNSYHIEDGILCVDTTISESAQIPGIMTYIQNTDSSYLNQLYKTLEWKIRNIDIKDFENSVILDLGSGIGLFLRSIYKELPENALYIAVDKDIRVLRSLKRLLEKADVRKNILFLNCDFLKIPLMNDSVDIICDMAGTSNYCFEHDDFLLSTLKKLFKTDARLLSTFLIFENFSEDSFIKPSYRKNFEIKKVKEQIKALAFREHTEYVSDSITKGGIYESYFNSNEKVIMYGYIGKRLG